MSSLVTEFSQPISDELPSGESLEYESDFLEMLKLAESRTQGGTIAGDEEEPTEEPADWKSVERLARGLLSKSHDCRVLVHLAVASLHTKGIEAFRDCLELLKCYLDDFWDSVHPQLDPDDNNDLTMRLNAVEMLDEYSLIVPALAEVKLVKLKGMGQFSLRDYHLAEGKETPRKKEQVPETAVIRQAFMQTDPQSLKTLRDATQGSIDLLKTIDENWGEKSGGEMGPSFDNTTKSLKSVVALLDEFTPSEDAAQGEVDGQGETAAVVTASGAIRNRTDVVRVLDNICEYYAENEPSSPIPFLLRRAQRLVEKSFMEILEDIVPDSVDQARIVSGDTENT